MTALSPAVSVALSVPIERLSLYFLALLASSEIVSTAEAFSLTVSVSGMPFVNVAFLAFSVTVGAAVSRRGRRGVGVGRRRRRRGGHGHVIVASSPASPNTSSRGERAACRSR